MKLNLLQFKVSDLNGKEYDIKDLPKTLGNSLYMDCSTIEQEDLSRKIHSGEEFEISKEDVQLLISYLEKKIVFTRWIQSKLINNLNNLLENNKEN